MSRKAVDRKHEFEFLFLKIDFLNFELFVERHCNVADQFIYLKIYL